MQYFDLLQRRHFLHQLCAGLLLASLPPSAWSQPHLDRDPFKLGVASGSPTSDSVVLWTRLVLSDLAPTSGPANLSVRWELADDEQFSRIVQRGIASAVPALAYSIHVEVNGLASDRWYFYRFIVGDYISALGRTRTFPKPEAKSNRLRLAYASCQKWEDGYFTAWRHMKREDLDAVLFLGDYIYEYPAPNSSLRTPSGGWVLTLDDYRRRYALYKSDADLQAMHATCPWLMTWDDHEVQNDYAGTQGGFSSSSDPSDPSQFLLRRAAAYQAYYEHMPIRKSALMRGLSSLDGAPPNGAELRIYSRVDFGRLASIYLLDARQYKDPQVCNKAGARGSSMVNSQNCPAWHDPQRSLLGAEQEHWLSSEFSKPASRENSWNVLGQQTLFGQRHIRTGTGRVLWNDGWDGYPAARTRLTASLLGLAVSNPVILGGDVHENWVGHVLANYDDPGSQRVGVEFCGTSITSRSGRSIKTAERLADNPHFVFAETQRRGYGVVELTPEKMTTALRVLDDVTLKETRIETLANFEVQHGTSFIERV